jgi:hypothetical protein
METKMNARWGTPAFGLVLGALFFAASALGGQPTVGIGMFAVMALWSGFLVVFGGRNETVGVLSGRPVDERLASFNILATAVAGTVALLVALIGFLWATAQGQNGIDFAVVAAAGGIAYLAALVWFRTRG